MKGIFRLQNVGRMSCSFVLLSRWLFLSWPMQTCKINDRRILYNNSIPITTDY